MALAVTIILVLSGICFFFIFFKRGPVTQEEMEAAAAKASTPKSAEKSKVRIDLSAFDEICELEGEVDFWPLPGNDYQSIKDLLDEGQDISPSLLNRNPPIKIAYTDNKHVKSTRDIIPFRIIGSIDKAGGQKEYDFYVEAFCLLRKGERSFHSNGISAAWVRGKEANLGDYLAELYEQSKKRQA